MKNKKQTPPKGMPQESGNLNRSVQLDPNLMMLKWRLGHKPLVVSRCEIVSHALLSLASVCETASSPTRDSQSKIDKGGALITSLITPFVCFARCIPIRPCQRLCARANIILIGPTQQIGISRDTSMALQCLPCHPICKLSCRFDPRTTHLHIVHLILIRNHIQSLPIGNVKRSNILSKSNVSRWGMFACLVLFSKCGNADAFAL